MKTFKKVTNKHQITGTRVIVKHNKIELALKQFKRKIKDSGIMLEMRDRQYYKKKSNRRRELKNLVKLRTKYRHDKENNTR